MATRVVVLCCDGPYQRHLVQRLHESFQVVGAVVREEPQAKGHLIERIWRYTNPTRLGRYLLARREMARASRLARPLLESLFHADGAEPAIPSDVPVVRVRDINAPEAVAAVKQWQPDIVCVNGTNLLREPMLALADAIPLGIINLHTGLSPYTRGGNCNLYALLEGRPEWVGVTVHYIDPGIDSGDLIMTAQVPLSEGDLFEHIDAKTFHLGAELMVEAVARLRDGTAERVPQWHDEGMRLYLKRTGFVYEPYHWYKVNRLLRKGLLASYLRERQERDAGVRLVG